MRPPARMERVVWWLLLLASTGSGTALMALFSRSYPAARAVLDHLASDGKLESFTLDRYASLRSPALAAGAILLAPALVLLVLREQSVRWIRRALGWPARLWNRLAVDAIRLRDDLRKARLARWEYGLLFGLVLLAAAARGALVQRPLEHDEAYTVVVFASEPVRELIADYHLPNNHIFHSLLVRLSLLTFGYPPWAVRLPALLAGVVAVAVVYGLARLLYTVHAAGLAAVSAALLPVLIGYGTNARGYTLVMLLSLCAAALAGYAANQKSLLAWMLFTITCATGFYTIPLFLYPFAVLVLWLFLLFLSGDGRPAYGSRASALRWLAASALGTVLLTGLLYLPVILRYGGVSKFQDTSERVSWSAYPAEFLHRVPQVWMEWTSGLPPLIGWSLLVGVVLSVVLPRRVLSQNPTIHFRVPLQMAAPLALALVAFLLRMNLHPRFVVFLLPWAVLWAAGGWVGLARLALASVPLEKRWGHRLAGAALAALILAGSIGILQDPRAFGRQTGEAEQAVKFLATQLQPYDLIVVHSAHDATLWYYSRLHAIDMDHYRRELPFFRAFIVVDPAMGESYAQVMKARGPETAFFGNHPPRLVFQTGSLQIFTQAADAALIRETYGLSPEGNGVP